MWTDHYKNRFIEEKKDIQCTYDEIIEILTPFVTQERWEQIQNVISRRIPSFVPVLENIYDRGNISAVMRSAEAFGFYNFNIVENKNQKFKSANRVTQGADKWLNISNYDSVNECLQNLKSRGFKIYVTHLESSKPIYEVDFSQSVALIFGNEKEGVSKEALELCDGSVILPMRGFSQSFNISVAAAISFYHAFHAKTKTPLHHCKDDKHHEIEFLDAYERQKLLANYLLRSVKSAPQILNKNLK